MNSQPELLTNAGIYAKPFPKFNRPEIIGYIGLENLKYARHICNKTVNFDLNLLVDEAQKKPPDLDVKLNDLIQFLSNNEKRLNLRVPNKIDSATIFCYRGLMTCVACSPFEMKDSWIIVAILFKGNIYLCARETIDRKLQKKHMSEKEKLFTSWGFKFEQYILSDKPHVKPNPNVPNNEMEEFSCVFKSTLNSHKIIYGAEMDGIRCDKKEVSEPPQAVDEVLKYLQDKEFIEVKTNRHIEHKHHQISFWYKAKKWWCQSFLVGIDTILCGYRNDNGIVEKLQTVKVNELPKISQGYWDPNVCFNFLDTFFVYVKRCLNREIRRKYGDKVSDLKSIPLTSLMFELNPDNCVQCFNYNHEDDPILPDWFLSSFGKYQEI